jgi:hypothetical protein
MMFFQDALPGCGIAPAGCGSALLGFRGALPGGGRSFFEVQFQVTLGVLGGKCTYHGLVYDAFVV